MKKLLFQKIAEFYFNVYIRYRYAAQAGTYENAVSTVISDYKKVKKIESKLKPIKVFSAIGGALSLAMGMKYTYRSIPGSIAYVAMGFDLFVISYNCYIKKYCAVAGKRYFNQVGEKVTTWIKDALGFKSGKDQADPIALLNDGDVDWVMLFEGTISKAVFAQIQAQLSSSARKNEEN